MTIRACLSSARLGPLFLCLASACSEPGGSADSGRSIGDGGGMVTTPRLVSSTPVDRATGIALNGSATATFSEPMDRATLTAESFALTSGAPPVAVPGRVIAAGAAATFWPAARLAPDTTYVATITTAARSAFGAPLAASHTWRFTTGTTVGPALPVALGASGDFAILAKSAVSTVPASAITGDVGLSPAAASFVTGFSLTADPTNVFSTSTQVTGHVYAADFAAPTPSVLTTAVADMELAFNDAAGRAPDVTELGAGDVGGMTLPPGVYSWGTGLLVPTDVTLSGSASDVWIFQIAQDLTVASGVRVRLAGGALAENVFWQVAGAVDLDTTAHLEGVVLSMTAITLHSGATINGRLLAQTAVVLDGSTVVEPAE